MLKRTPAAAAPRGQRSCKAADRVEDLERELTLSQQEAQVIFKNKADSSVYLISIYFFSVWLFTSSNQFWKESSICNKSDRCDWA